MIMIPFLIYFQVFYVILTIGLYPIIRINVDASDSTASGRAGLSTQYALGFLVFARRATATRTAHIVRC